MLSAALLSVHWRAVARDGRAAAVAAACRWGPAGVWGPRAGRAACRAAAARGAEAPARAAAAQRGTARLLAGARYAWSRAAAVSSSSPPAAAAAAAPPPLDRHPNAASSRPNAPDGFFCALLRPPAGAAPAAAPPADEAPDDDEVVDAPEDGLLLSDAQCTAASKALSPCSCSLSPAGRERGRGQARRGARGGGRG
jgi:hypothetical protein